VLGLRWPLQRWQGVRKGRPSADSLAASASASIRSSACGLTSSASRPAAGVTYAFDAGEQFIRFSTIDDRGRSGVCAGTPERASTSRAATSGPELIGLTVPCRASTLTGPTAGPHSS